MRLVVISHKPCWPSDASSSGYATDGGFPMQMRAISELADETSILVPVPERASHGGEMALSGRHLRVVPLAPLTGRGLGRKLRLPFWLCRTLPTLARELRRADAVHTPIPGDVGTIGLLMALVMRKPLFVRYCGNWLARRTIAERFWGWLLERIAGGRNVVLTTGGDDTQPSTRNGNIRWIFSSSLTETELRRYGTPRAHPGTRPPRLIIACRQEEKKGTDVVIATLPTLCADFPGLRLDVVGSGSQLPQLRQLAADLGMAESVTFHGHVDHDAVMSLLQQADVFCFPTMSSEGFPKVVLEAMACGLPVVTTPVSVLPRLMRGGGGRLLNSSEPADVADGVRWCLEDAVRYESLSASAVATAGHYSLERWRDSIGMHLSTHWPELRHRA